MILNLSLTGQVVRYEEAGIVAVAPIPEHLLHPAHHPPQHFHPNVMVMEAGGAAAAAAAVLGGTWLPQPDARSSDVLTDTMQPAEGSVTDLRGKYSSVLLPLPAISTATSVARAASLALPAGVLVLPAGVLDLLLVPESVVIVAQNSSCPMVLKRRSSP